MPTGETEAQALLHGDRAAAARLATGLLQPLNNNFVERPWGGFALHELKGGAVPALGAHTDAIRTEFARPA